MERALSECFDHLFLNVDVNRTPGSKLVAALGHTLPRCSRAGKTRLMPSVFRSFQVWQRLRPTGTRMPKPIPAVCGVSMLMAQQGDLDLARLTLVAADCYLRPGEVINLTSAGAKASKGGVFEDSIVCDSLDRPLIVPMLVLMKTAVPPSTQLVDHILSERSQVLSEHGRWLGICTLTFCGSRGQATTS
jgi:hypothetical protein